MNKSFNIQLIRAISTLGVLFFHTSLISEKYSPGLSHILIYVCSIGKYFVSTFFVLSGFLIAKRYCDSELIISKFILKRLLRIYPTYFILSTVFLLAIYVKHSSVDVSNYFRSLMFISHLSGGTPTLYVGWSLEIEMLFYFLFVMLARNLWIITISVLAFTLIMKGALAAYLCEITLGFVLGAFLRENKNLTLANFSMLSLVVLSLAPLSEVICVFSTVILLVLISVKRLNNDYSDGFKYLNLVGDASYSIYLSHPIVLPLIVPLLAGIFGESYIVFVISIFMSIIIGIFVFNNIESRFSVRP